MSDLGARLRERTRAEIDAEDLLTERRRLAIVTARALQQACSPLDEALKALHPRPELEITNDKLTHTMLHTRRYQEQVVFTFERTSKIASALDPRRYVIAYGRGLDLLDDGTLVLGAYVMVHFEEVMGTDFHWQAEPRRAPAGSIEAERAVQDLVGEIAPQLAQALGRVARVPARQRATRSGAHWGPILSS